MEYKGYTIHNSDKPDKQYYVVVKGKRVYFGDPNMKDYPGTRRGDNYCTRSLGIKNKNGLSTANDPMSPNYWSRRVIWNCKGKKSLKK